MTSSHKKHLYFLLVLSGVMIIFHNGMEDVWSRLIVDPILSLCESQWYNDLIFIALAVLTITNYAIKIYNNHVVSFQRVLYMGLATILLLNYRILSNKWEFQSFSFYDSIKYLDTFFLYSLGLLILFVRNQSKPKRGVNPSPISLIIDEPIETDTEDELERTDLAKHIAERLENTKSNKSIAIGITGSWGSGKTSFLNLIASNFDNDSTVVVKFNPWISLDEKSVVSDFFATLSSSLSKYSSHLSDQLLEYGRSLLSSNGSALSNAISFSDRFLNEYEDFNVKFEHINQTLDKLDKQVIVLIDDLDRLDKREVIETIRLVRNTANFRHVKFIVAFDRDYVVNAIKALNSHNHDEYLEKIFLQVTELPPIDSTHIRQSLHDILIDRFPGHKTNIKDAIFGNAIKSVNFTDNLIVTVRDVKRFLNYFIVDFQNLEGEVSLEDFLRIVLLKFKYPSIYRLLYLNGDRYIDLTKTNNYVTESSTHTLAKGDSKKSILEEDLHKYSQQYNVPENEIQVPIKLLEGLFPDNTYPSYSSKNHLSIKFPRNYHKYFISRLLNSDLSEREFNTYINSDYDILINQIQNWVNEGKKTYVVDRYRKISTYDITDKAEFEKIIRSIFFIGNCHSENADESTFRFGYFDDDLFSKLYDGENEITDKFYDGKREDYKAFLVELFNSDNTHHFFEGNFIRYIVKNSRSGLPFTTEELQSLQLGYFKDYMERVSTLDNDLWHYYHNCIIREEFNRQGNSYQVRYNKDPKANELFIEFLRKNDLNTFLKDIIRIEPFEEERFGVHDIVIEIFGSYDEFEKFLETIENKGNSILKEFRAFLLCCKAVEYKNYIPFEFKTIDLSDRYRNRKKKLML